MLALKPFRDKAAGVADLLNWSHLVDSRDRPVQGRLAARRVVLSGSRHRQQHGW